MQLDNIMSSQINSSFSRKYTNLKDSKSDDGVLISNLLLALLASLKVVDIPI